MSRRWRRICCGGNYELTDSELDQLLAFRCADPSSLQWMRDVFSVATGRTGPKASTRWRRLTLLAQGPMPDLMLLEDAEDVCDFIIAMRRTIHPARWADEAIAAANMREVEGLF